MIRKRLLVAALVLCGPTSGLWAQISPTPRDLFGPDFDFTSRDKWLERLARSPKIDLFESLEPDCGRMSPGMDAVRLRVTARPGGDPIREVEVHVVLAPSATSTEEFPTRIFRFSDATGVPELERRVAFSEEVRFLDRVRGYTIVVNRIANRRINQRYKPFLQIRLGDPESTPVVAAGTGWRFENFATVSADTFSVTAELRFDDGVTWRDILVREEGTRSGLVFRPGWGGWFWMSDVYLETTRRAGTAAASREGWVSFRSNPARDSPCGAYPASASTRFRAPAAPGTPGTSPPPRPLPDLQLALADASRGSVKIRVTNAGSAPSVRTTEVRLNAGAVTTTAEVPGLSTSGSFTTDWLDIEGPAGGLPDEFSVSVNVPRRFDESNYSNNSLSCRRRSVSEPGLVWDCPR